MSCHCSSAGVSAGVSVGDCGSVRVGVIASVGFVVGLTILSSVCRRLQQYMLLSRTTSSVFFAVHSVRSFSGLTRVDPLVFLGTVFFCHVLFVARHFCCCSGVVLLLVLC